MPFYFTCHNCGKPSLSALFVPHTGTYCSDACIPRQDQQQRDMLERCLGVTDFQKAEFYRRKINQLKVIEPGLDDQALKKLKELVEYLESLESEQLKH